MSNLEFRHSIHGDDYHNQVIMQTKCLLIQGGATILDGSVFKNCQPPCMPDVYFKWDEILRVGNTKRHATRYGVIEVETNATRESRELKRRQYEEQRVGIMLFIFDLAQVEEGRWRDWVYLKDWIKKRLPV